MGRRLNNDFTCHKCKKQCEELTSYGPYGLDNYKLRHDGEYCLACFNEINKRYIVEEDETDKESA